MVCQVDTPIQLFFLTPCVESTWGKYDQLKPLQESVGSLLSTAIAEADQDQLEMSLNLKFKLKFTQQWKIEKTSFCSYTNHGPDRHLGTGEDIQSYLTS